MESAGPCFACSQQSPHWPSFIHLSGVPLASSQLPEMQRRRVFQNRNSLESWVALGIKVFLRVLMLRGHSCDSGTFYPDHPSRVSPEPHNWSTHTTSFETHFHAARQVFTLENGRESVSLAEAESPGNLDALAKGFHSKVRTTPGVRDAETKTSPPGTKVTCLSCLLGAPSHREPGTLVSYCIRSIPASLGL